MSDPGRIQRAKQWWLLLNELAETLVVVALMVPLVLILRLAHWLFGGGRDA